jgi:hypothetical protein
MRPALAAFSFASWLPVAMLIMPVAGFGMVANFAAANTVLQTLADDDKRGARDELLHDGVHRHGAVRQPARGLLPPLSSEAG